MQGDRRKIEVVFYLTEKDAKKLTRVSKQLGFSSRARLLTGIIESLMIGGFSALGFLQTALKIGKIAKKRNVGVDAGYYFANRPLETLVVEPVTASEIQQGLVQIKERIEQC